VKPPRMSYHDVSVYVNGVKYEPSKNYALQLHCTKTAGWRLYYVWDGAEKLIGGEYDSESFCIMVADMVICGEKPEAIQEPKPFGWDGVVTSGVVERAEYEVREVYGADGLRYELNYIADRGGEVVHVADYQHPEMPHPNFIIASKHKKRIPVEEK